MLNKGSNTAMASTKKSLVDTARIHGCASLLSVNSDSKTIKGVKEGFLTGVMYMMPDDQLCPMSELAGCREACLVTAGRAAFTPGIGQARAGRTAFFRKDRDAFMELLFREITGLVNKAAKQGLTPAIRPNGTSDINWSNVIHNGQTIFEAFPTVQFYDYTKSPSIIRAAAGESNWSVTASYSGASQKYAMLIKAAADKYGSNLAVVFRSADLPDTFMGKTVVNGDKNDLRFLDDANVVVGLKAKGQAKSDTSGFVVDADQYNSNLIMAA